MNILDDMNKYAACMEEIKNRQRAIADILNGDRTTSFEMTNIEFVCLQFRKILELIAMASLAANSEEYKKTYKKFYEHWKAKRILNDIEKINPHFYPVPTRQVIENGVVVKVENINEGFLTKDDFENVYSECSGLLHSENPYSKKKVNLEELKQKFFVWDSKIIQLLNHHQIQLLDNDYQLWVVMQVKDSDKVQVVQMQRLDKK